MENKRGRLIRLEAVRGFAAMIVIVSHQRLFTACRLDFLDHFGVEAVMLFFLLSGFVIHYSSFGRAGGDRDSSKGPSFRRYLVHRFRRIYPLMLISFGAAYGTQSLAVSQWLPVPWRTLGGNLIMLQDIASAKRGVWFATFCHNGPLWSLSYEWWFYMLFFPLFTWLWARPAAQKYWAGAITIGGFLMFQIHPNEICLILGYFALWWSGVELSREYCVTQRITWKRQFPNLMILAVLSLFWSTPVLLAIRRHLPIRSGTDPLLQLRNYATALAMLAAAIAWYKCHFRGFTATLQWFAVVAPVSYAIYIFHVPVFQAISFVLPAVPVLLQFIISLAVLLPICYLLEVRMQRHINRWCDAFV